MNILEKVIKVHYLFLINLRLDYLIQKEYKLSIIHPNGNPIICMNKIYHKNIFYDFNNYFLISIIDIGMFYCSV
jgi:hypothetical protein